MSFKKEKQALRTLYASKKQWFQSTPTYGCWIYPDIYYIKLKDLETKHSN